MSHSSDVGAWSAGSLKEPRGLPIANGVEGADGVEGPSESLSAGPPQATAKSSAAPGVADADSPADPAPTAREWTKPSLPALIDVSELADDAPPWLISAIAHMLVLILLGLAFISEPTLSRFALQLDPRDNGDDLQPGELDLPMEFEQPLLDNLDALQPQEVESTQATDALVDAVEMPTSPLGRILQAHSSPIRMSLSGREEGMREALLAAYGGTASTEESVKNALSWLTRNQINRTGLWSLSGPYTDGARSDNPDAASALALLAFQGAGYTPDSDPNDVFTKVVRRGWNALLKRQRGDGNFFNQGQAHGRFYTQAIATIAICELYGMTENSEYRDPAQRAVDYCVSMQTSEGGWRYYEHSGSDLSVTGWFVMALQSARMAGLDVPQGTLTRIDRFLDSVSRDLGAQYAYLPADGPRRSMTAEGLLCRQYLGWSRSNGNLSRGVSLLVENLPSADDREAYYWYYATQVCHHMEGAAWRKWNGQMRTVLPSLQVRSGRERGSWDPRGDKSVAMNGGGRLFITCLSTYMLEVYYRHLPLYQLELLHSTR